jgi:integrase
VVAYKYSLYRRYSKRLDKDVYYARFRDPDTEKRLPGRSTGKTTLNEAKIWCDDQLRSGFYSPHSQIKFRQYAQGWYQWGNCKYIQRKLSMDQNITPQHADTQLGNLNNYILPLLPDIRISRIRTHHIEDFRMELLAMEGVRGNPLSAGTINKIVSTLSVMLGEAHRLGYIPHDPSKGIGKLGSKSAKELSFVTDEEFKRLFDPSMKQFIWKDDRHYTMNLLAALTGIRQGECLGISINRVQEDRLIINRAWKRKYGFGTTKTRVNTKPELSADLYRLLSDLIQSSPYHDDPDSLVFYGPDAYTPIDHKTILETLYKALDRIGIKEAERNERVIRFHSWRHYFVTTGIRYNVPGALIRASTGHKTDTMLNHYWKW